jgi:tripartite ATP-independent transporter DctM subunit
MIVALLLVALLLIGTPIFAVLLGAGAYGATFGRGMTDFAGQVSDIIGIGTSEKATVLSTIPLFILAGYFLAESKTADRIVKVSQAGLGWLPGSLAVVTIFACAIFTTFTGASGVTIVALGTLLMPALVKQKYPEQFSLGLIGGTGSIGLLFPPALPLFIYGTVFGFVYQTMSDTGVGEMKLVDWDTERFIFAGIVPGILLVGIISIYAMIQAVRKGVKPDWSVAEAKRDFGPAFIRALPEIAIPFLVILAIAKGVSIPQAAALTVVYTFILEVFVYRDLSLKKLGPIVKESMALVGAIFIIIFCATGFTNWLVTAEVPQTLLKWITATFSEKWMFLLALNVVLLGVGMTMDIFSAIVVVVPLITPAAMAFDLDPYHLGVIFLLNLEIGYLTPPVGLNLFITSYTFNRPIDRVVKATFPFLLCMVAALLLVTYIPALTIYPEAERRGSVRTLATKVEGAAARASSIQELALPDGATLRLADCDAIADTIRKVECTALFATVTKCRADEGEGSACETESIAAYVAAGSGGTDLDDWGSDDWGDGAAEDGAGEDDGAGEGQDEPPGADPEP